MDKAELQERRAQLRRQTDELETRILETRDKQALNALEKEMGDALDELREVNLILADYEADGRAIII